MSLMRQDEIGRCDFIDVLEEAVLVGRPVAVRLRGGESFIDSVSEVVTHDGKDFAVFTRRGKLAVEEIASCSRAEPRHELYRST